MRILDPGLVAVAVVLDQMLAAGGSRTIPVLDGVAAAAAVCIVSRASSAIERHTLWVAANITGVTKLVRLSPMSSRAMAR